MTIKVLFADNSTCELPDTWSCVVGKLDDEKIPVAVNAVNLEYFVQYGIDQSGNDKHAGLKIKDFPTKADGFAAVRKRVVDWAATIATKVPGQKGPTAIEKAIMAMFGGRLPTPEEVAKLTEIMAKAEAEAKKSKAA